MMTNKRKPPVAALFIMFFASALFSLCSAFPASAQDTTPPSKPIGASPGGAAVPVKPKATDTDKTDQKKDSDKTSSEAAGVGASAGGAGSSTAFAGVSLKKALIIGGSVVGVIALLLAGGGGSDGGGSTPTH